MPIDAPILLTNKVYKLKVGYLMHAHRSRYSLVVTLSLCATCLAHSQDALKAKIPVNVALLTATYVQRRY
mgnify:FL=1